jgi:putative ABC transport system permease protein
VAELADMTLGDRLHFDLQGIPLEAEISSIRTRQSLSITPFFYFVFQPKDLAGAPQTHFAALRVPPGEIASLQDRLANRLPNLSLIDLTDSVRVFARIMHKMTTLIRSFMVLSLLAGGLILLGSICATRRARLAESVFLKLGGATRGFLHGVFALEHLALAAGSAAAALLLALVAADLTCRFHFEIPFTLRPSLLVGGFLIHAATLVLVSVITLRRTCRQRPADLLREVFHE